MKFAIVPILAGTIGLTFAGESAPQSSTQFRDRAQPYLTAALAAGSAFVNVSSASAMPNIAPDSLATALGSSLAASTETGTAPYPTSLGGISLQVVDGNGVVRLAQLLYVSPTQINYLIPADTPTGLATTNIINGTGSILSSTAQIQTVAPALFTANGDGKGVVAATAFRTAIPTTMTFPVPVFQCGSAPGSCVAVPIDPGLDRPVTIDFYATGLRRRSSDSAVTLTINGQAVPIRSITSPDDTTASAGVDIVEVGLSLSLRGSGEVDVVLAVDGASSNVARINIQ
jgi:uncharacterized protein (TIGR03437 family)